MGVHHAAVVRPRRLLGVHVRGAGVSGAAPASLRLSPGARAPPALPGPAPAHAGPFGARGVAVLGDAGGGGLPRARAQPPAPAHGHRADRQSHPDHLARRRAGELARQPPAAAAAGRGHADRARRRVARLQGTGRVHRRRRGGHAAGLRGRVVRLALGRRTPRRPRRGALALAAGRAGNARRRSGRIRARAGVAARADPPVAGGRFCRGRAVDLGAVGARFHLAGALAQPGRQRRALGTRAHPAGVGDGRADRPDRVGRLVQAAPGAALACAHAHGTRRPRGGGDRDRLRRHWYRGAHRPGGRRRQLREYRAHCRGVVGGDRLRPAEYLQQLGLRADPAVRTPDQDRRLDHGRYDRGLRQTRQPPLDAYPDIRPRRRDRAQLGDHPGPGHQLDAARSLRPHHRAGSRGLRQRPRAGTPAPSPGRA